MPDVAVEVEGLVVRFGPVTALEGVDLRVHTGELVAVTGHSGAGKTTLLSAIAGIVRPDAGSVTVRGVVVDGLGSAAGAGVTVIPQGNGLVALLSAVENVVVPLVARSVGPVGPDGAAQRAAEALDAVGLGEVHRHLVEELSGGQQQRVAVARGLALAGPVLLADEPTSELDHASRAVVLTRLRARALAGAAVVVTTHDPEAAEAADRVLHLEDGVLGPA